MSTSHPFDYSGRTGGMVRLALINLLLSVLTLSVYRFWGKTKVRSRLWSGIRAWGDPVEYTGTGRELFIGFLIVLLAVYAPLVAAAAGAQALLVAGSPLGGVLLSLLYFVTVLLVAAGLFRARRYQLSRTRWRGIRGGQDGSAISYALRSMLVWAALPLSLGWAWPAGEMWLARYRFNHTVFGDRRFACDAGTKGLYGRFLLVWISGLVFFLVVSFLGWAAADVGRAAGLEREAATLLFLPVAAVAAALTLGLPWAWYRAAFYRNLAAGLSFEGCRFSADIGTWSLVRLAAGNAVISFLSLGILRPWAALRVFRYGCAAVAVEGEPDFARVGRNEDGGPRSGEGLAAVFDGAGEF